MIRVLRQVQLVLGPALTAAVIILGALIAISVVAIYAAEHGENTHAASFGSALSWVVLSLVADSPWAPETVQGNVVSFVVQLLKPISIAVITAAITSYLFQLIVRRGSGMGRARVKDHIVICGWSSKGSEILREIRGRGDEESQRPVVVLASLPSNPTRDGLTTFISGDPTDEDDLRRAGITRARTAIVLADNSYPDIDIEDMDSKTLITTLAIESLNPDCYTCVEVVHSHNRDHFKRAKADELVVSAHLTGALLAHSAVTRGLSKVVGDLLTHPEGTEFYWIPVPTMLAGRTFREALSTLKIQHDCLPLAVSRDGGGYVTNPPGDQVLRLGDRLLVIAKSAPAI